MTLRKQLRYAAGTARANKVMFEGDENAGVLTIGQVIGGIRDVPTCKELVERVVAQAESVLNATGQKTLG